MNTKTGGLGVFVLFAAGIFFTLYGMIARADEPATEGDANLQTMLRSWQSAKEMRQLEASAISTLGPKIEIQTQLEKLDDSLADMDNWIRLLDAEIERTRIDADGLSIFDLIVEKNKARITREDLIFEKDMLALFISESNPEESLALASNDEIEASEELSAVDASNERDTEQCPECPELEVREIAGKTELKAPESPQAH